MSDHTRNRALRTMLIATGLIFMFGIATLMRAWPAGFACSQDGRVSCTGW
jgi:hypothetical protein